MHDMDNNNAPVLPVINADLPLINEAQAATLLAVQKQTLRSWRSRGIGPPYTRVRRCIRYSRAALCEYLARHTTMPTSL
jgi:hypothetical protein